MIGDVLDHYRVLELIGRGAMGVVYKALDVNLDRQVAIKVMSVEARNDPDFVQRFRQEARIQGALNHPNVALLFDYFLHDGTPVAVMEFIDGESLEQMIKRRGAIPAREAIPLFRQALLGVAVAHRAGIVHRDLKPGNLMVTRDGIVKVMDFGIAKRQGVTGATKASTSIGSPLYMAPEQILGRPVDCRTDIYALGVTLYELLAGQRPFNSRAKAEYLVLDAHVNELPEPPTVYRYGIPQPIVDAVMRSLAKDPDARFQSAEEFMQALPDVPAPIAAAPVAAASRVGPTGTVALAPRTATARVGPTCTLAIEPKAATSRVGPTGTVAIGRAPPSAPEPVAAPAQVNPASTVSLEYAPPPESTVDIEVASATRRDPAGSMAFDFSAGTVWQQLHPPERSAQAAASPATVPVTAAEPSVPARPHPTPRRRAYGLGFAAVLVAVLTLGAVVKRLIHLHTPQLAATAPSIAANQPASPTPAAPADSAAATPVPPADPPAATPVPPADSALVATTPPATSTVPATTTAPARRDLSGTWRGEYVDASGRQLLRVVSLSISRVREDGGIEGTLEYQAASGNGECELHPRGSNYRARERRLQLSPEGCSPHHPRELGVPLDFAGVNPGANTLRDGRIEAPTGQVVRVRLQRVSGV